MIVLLVSPKIIIRSLRRMKLSKEAGSFAKDSAGIDIAKGHAFTWHRRYNKR